MSHHVQISFAEIIAFLAIWYLLTIITYGTNVPAGLFLPGMIIGCAIGQIYTMILLEYGIFEQEEYDS
jgi:H+/Cl- antiporter ClcA